MRRPRELLIAAAWLAVPPRQGRLPKAHLVKLTRVGEAGPGQHVQKLVEPKETPIPHDRLVAGQGVLQLHDVGECVLHAVVLRHHLPHHECAAGPQYMKYLLADQRLVPDRHFMQHHLDDDGIEMPVRERQIAHIRHHELLRAGP